MAKKRPDPNPFQRGRRTTPWTAVRAGPFGAAAAPGWTTPFGAPGAWGGRTFPPATPATRTLPWGWRSGWGGRPAQRPLPGSGLPPAGSYDPALDAEARAAQRGYGDLRSDTTRDQSRMAVDYGLGVEAINRDFGRNSQDLTTGYDRSIADIGTARGYEGEDYSASLAALQRSYDRLGSRQMETANQAGVLQGGAVLQAAAKRAANQAFDRQPIDVNHQRAVTGFDTSQQRLTADYGTNAARLGEDRGVAAGNLALGYTRGTTDLQTTLRRAGRENTAFGLDINAQKSYQAAQGGWTPPERRRRRRK